MAETKKETVKKVNAKSTTTKSAPAKKATSTTKKATTTKTVAKRTVTEKVAATTETKKPVAKKVEQAKVVSEPKKEDKKMIRVTLVRSPIGYNRNQAKVVKALGLNKLHSTKLVVDNACTRGMVAKVSHLVRVEEI